MKKNICIINYNNDVNYAILLTSIFKEMSKNNNIFLLTKKEYEYLYKYNKNINFLSTDEFLLNINFDESFNITPKIEICSIYNNIKSEKKYGFINNNLNIEYLPSNELSTDFFDLMFSSNIINRSFLKIFFNFFNLKWSGQGYDLNYFPKTKCKKNTLGILIKDNLLKTFLNDSNFFNNLNFKKNINIPCKNNLFKRMNEINICSSIVTDDLVTCQLSIYLKKYVHFINFNNLKAQIEFFNNGQLYDISYK